MTEPYVGHYGNRGAIEIEYVDSDWIRNNLDEEWTNYGQHFRYPYIPEYKFWIDSNAGDEARFYVDHLLIEFREMQHGVPYAKALEAADRAEKAERAKSQGLSKGEVIHVPQYLIGYLGKVPVDLVVGEAIRDSADIDFVEGGNSAVYKFQSDPSVWIEVDVTPAERVYIIIHEGNEYILMKTQHLSYDEAHVLASQVEWDCRHGKQLTTDVLKRLDWRPVLD